MTAREVEILQLCAAGLTARMTAERLEVSTATISTQLETIYLTSIHRSLDGGASAG